MRSSTFKDIKAKFESSRDYTVFVVGDSITEGARATDREKTYTAVFAKKIAERYKGRTVIRYDGKRYDHPDAELMPLSTYGEPICVQSGGEGKITVVRSGIGGNTVRRMLSRRTDFIDREVGGNAADLFIVMVGINDALRQDASKYVTHEVFFEHLAELIKVIDSSSKPADIIFMTPTYNDGGTSGESHLEPYADEMRRISKENGIPLIDQHSLWMHHLTVGGENYGQGDWLCGVKGDYCHPGNVGHEAIANEMIRAIFESAN